MIIEVTGGGFGNKGAQLMLATVAQRMRERIPDVRLTMPMLYGRYEERAQYGIYATIDRPTKWTRPRGLAREIFTNVAVRSPLKDVLGIVEESKVDALVDISGYAFGDKWPVAKTNRLAKRAKRCKLRGRPTVMLPQMLGPFNEPRQADAFCELTRHVDLIYAREQESFDHARPLVDSGKLRLAPDITITTPPHPTPVSLQPYVCLVPNSKLLEPNPQSASWGDSYIQRLTEAAAQIIERGFEVRVVQHEYGVGDEILVSALAERLGLTGHGVVKNRDPQYLKGVLAGAQLVIGSRFHSLVSSLSAGVPSIALGWAHKYEMLLSDFGVPELIHRVDDSQAHLLELVSSALASRDELSLKIKGRQKLLATQVELMWSEVFQLLRSCPEIASSVGCR